MLELISPLKWLLDTFLQYHFLLKYLLQQKISSYFYTYEKLDPLKTNI